MLVNESNYNKCTFIVFIKKKYTDSYWRVIQSSILPFYFFDLLSDDLNKIFIEFSLVKQSIESVKNFKYIYIIW